MGKLQVPNLAYKQPWGLKKVKVRGPKAQPANIQGLAMQQIQPRLAPKGIIPSGQDWAPKIK